MKKFGKSARASIEGHRYHWAWATRRALSLLDEASSLSALAIEGFTEANEKGNEVADLVEFHEGHDFESCRKIVVQQFKYSLTTPNENFTWSFVLGSLQKFASQYSDWKKEYGSEIHKKVRFEFITNRPAVEYVANTFKELSESQDLSNLNTYTKKALGKVDLPKSDLIQFFQIVKLQHSGGTVFNEELAAQRVLADWSPGTDATSRFALIQKRVLDLAGAAGTNDNLLRAADIWAILGIRGPEDLFPVPSYFPEVGQVIKRDELQQALSHIEETQLPLLVTAGGGVGKTVFLQSLQQSLATKYETVLYDCFAEGRYRIEGDERHKSANACTQIVNALARRGICDPLIPTSSSSLNYIQTIRLRLTQAISTLNKQSNKLGIVILIDAADNAAELALAQNVPCFLHGILDSLQRDPIDGIHLVLSCRDYRKHKVIQDYSYVLLELQGLSRESCLEIVRAFDPDIDNGTARKIVAQARGNPRKLDYLLKLDADSRPTTDSIDLNTIFDMEWKRISRQFIDQGFSNEEQSLVMAALARLPPPIPLAAMATALNLDIVLLRTLGTELFPLMEEAHDGLIFRDEPIESWFRDRFSVKSEAVNSLIQTFLESQSHSRFAADALPGLLVEAQKDAELIKLANNDSFPTELVTQSARHKLAAKRILSALGVTIKSGNYDQSMALLYRYGRLATVSERADSYVASNVGLSAISSDPDARARLWEGRFGWQGAWHARIAFYQAVSKDIDGAVNSVSVFEDWMDWWFRIGRDETDDNYHTPSLENHECAVDALVATSETDFKNAAVSLLRWIPPEAQENITYIYLDRLRYLPEIDIDSLLADFYEMAETAKNISSKNNSTASKKNGTVGFALSLFSFVPHSHNCFNKVATHLNQALENFEFATPAADGLKTPALTKRILQAAVKAMAAQKKLLCKRLLRSTSVEPSIYCFHDTHDRDILASFLLHRVTVAYSRNREFTHWDVLPKAFRDRIKISTCTDAETVKKALGDVVQAHKKKKKTQTRSGLNLDDGKLEHVNWTVSELYTWGKLLDSALKHGLSAEILNSLFDRNDLDGKQAPYFLYNSAGFVRRSLAGNILRSILFSSRYVSDDSLKVILQRLNENSFYLDQSYSLLDALHTVDHNDRVKSQLVVKYAKAVSEYETVDDRSTAYSNLAHRAMQFDQQAAIHLFLKGLDCIDGVGSDDHDLVRALLGLAEDQTGGILEAKSSNRFLNLCEINFEYSPDKFPFDELARAAAKSIGFEYFSRLINWHDRDKVPLHYGWLSACARFVEEGLLSPSQGTVLSLLAEGTGCWSIRAGDLYQKLYQTADEVRKPIIQDILNWLSERENGEGYVWQTSYPEESELEASKKSPTFTRDKNRCSELREIGLGLDPTHPNFVDELFDRVRDKFHHGDVFSVLEETISKRLKSTYVKSFLEKVIFSDHGHPSKKIDLVNFALRKWEDSSVILLESRPYFYKLLLASVIEHNLDSDFGVSRDLTDLSEFSDKERKVVAADAIAHIVDNNLIPGSVSAFSLAQALLEGADPKAAHVTLNEFLLSQTFEDVEAFPLKISQPCSMDPAMVVGQIVWHQLGDPDAVLRWRAVHSVIQLATLRLDSELETLFSLFHQSTEDRISDPDHSFHIWNAREYFLIAMLKLARQNSDFIAEKYLWFEDIANGHYGHTLFERYAGNILSILSSSDSNKEVVSRNSFPKTELPTVKRDGYYGRGDGWDTDLEKKYGFRLDYEFRKVYPSEFSYQFDISKENAGPLFMKSVRQMDPHIEDMYNTGGRPSEDADYSRDFREHRHIRYGQHIAKHAVFRCQSHLLKSNSLIKDEWTPGREIENLLSYQTITFDDGRLLSDETVPIPQFASKSILNESDRKKQIEPAENILLKLGYLGTDQAELWVPVFGSWRTPDGASISIHSAFTAHRGSVRRAKSLVKVRWVDLWLPDINHDPSRTNEHFNERAAEYRPWITTFDSDAGIDRWDRFGSVYATGKSILSDCIASDLGLYREGFIWKDKSSTPVIKSVAWGNKVTQYRDDSDNLGHNIIARPDFLQFAVQELDLSLIISVGITYYPNSRYNSGEKSLDGGVILRISGNEPLRFWQRKVVAQSTPY